MKQKQVVIAGLILVSLVALFFFVNLHTASAININPTNTEDPLGIGINAGDLPQTPEDLANASASYLQTRWEQFFTESKTLGPIHRTFLANPLPFKILFNEPYSFTLTFLCILVLWIFLLVSIGNIVGAYSGSGMVGAIFGLLAVIVLAQIGVIGGIAKFVANFTNQSIWIKILFWIAVFIILVLIYTFDSMWKKSIKASKKLKEKKMLKEKVEEHEEFVTGVEEGRILTKDLRKLKKKASDIDYQI